MQHRTPHRPTRMNDPAGADECVGVTLNEQLSTHRGIRTPLIEQTTVSGLVESGSGFLLQNGLDQWLAIEGLSITLDALASPLHRVVRPRLAKAPS